MNPTLRNKLVGTIAGGSGAIIITAVILCTADGPGKAARRTFSATLLSAPARRCCFFTNQFFGLQQRFRFCLRSVRIDLLRISPLWAAIPESASG